MTHPSITNRGEFFSNHYLDTILTKDLTDLRARWDSAEGRSEDTARTRLRGLGRRFFNARADAAEAPPPRLATPVAALNDLVLTALGFIPQRETVPMLRASVDKLEVPLAAQVHDATGLILVALDAGLAADVDDLFDTATDHAPGQLLAPLWRVGDKKQVAAVSDAVGELFACDEPPRYVLVCAGRMVLLADRARWAEGRFLAVDLDAALERNDTTKGGELETIAALFSYDVLVATDGPSVLDELTEKSHKHAVGVSKELRLGIRRSIEILAKGPPVNYVVVVRLRGLRGVPAMV